MPDKYLKHPDDWPRNVDGYLTFALIGERLGISAVRVQQLHERALRKMRQSPLLRDFVLGTEGR